MMRNVQCSAKANIERYSRQGTRARCVRDDCSDQASRMSDDVKREVAGSVPRRTQVKRHTITKQPLLTTWKEPKNACGIGSTCRSRLLVVARRLDTKAVFATDGSGVIGKTYGESKSVIPTIRLPLTNSNDAGHKLRPEDTDGRRSAEWTCSKGWDGTTRRRRGLPLRTSCSSRVTCRRACIRRCGVLRMSWRTLSTDWPSRLEKEKVCCAS